jgi:hypothetical protein
MTTSIYLRTPAACGQCGFTTSDINLLAGHSCDIQEQGGRCEDFPCCGHEAGDCNGQLYGSDEAIKAQVYADIASGHGDCDHAEGLYFCDSYDNEDYDEDE